MLAHMQQFLATNKDLQAAKQSIGPCISSFDPELACQPQGIFCKVSALASFGVPSDGCPASQNQSCTCSGTAGVPSAVMRLLRIPCQELLTPIT